jgi:hypothetical protein
MTASDANTALMTGALEGGGSHRGPRTVQVRRSAGGVWEVLFPDETDSAICDTLSAARRVARRWAQDNPPSELIIRDAYHRVVLRRSFRDTDRSVVN